MLNFFKTCFLPFKTGSVFENYVIWDVQSNFQVN